jgi:7-cyano-7-deazaguanine synthase in queuosine biosynthesis
LRGEQQNVALHSDDIGRRMLASVRGVLADLLEVATYVYCADQFMSRGGATGRGLAANWRRDLRFVIPVREPDRWSSPEVGSSLQRVLAFMSDDNVRFEFIAEITEQPSTEYFDFGSGPDEVVLFSGGLDSLAGAADRLAGGNSRLLLVSLQSSSKIANRQRELARELAQRFPNRVVHIPIRVHTQVSRATETTQRTRSFLFGALGAAVAQVGDTNRLSLFENGVVSINLPIAGQVVGTAASRTTHPRVLRDLSDFLSALCQRAFSVENPYLWKTKAEVIEVLRDAGHADLAKYTASCSRVHQMTRLHTHCGCCSQCLDRRFAALGAGLGDDDPSEMYAFDLLTETPEDPLDLTMAEAFVRHALELDGLSELGFISKFGGEVARVASCVSRMSADQIARAMLDLHHRHAKTVRAVLEAGYRQHAASLAARTLPTSCLLRLVAGPGGIAPAMAVPATMETPLTDDRAFRTTSQVRIALDSKSARVLLGGGRAIEGSAAFRLLSKLVEIALEERAKPRAPERYRFIKAASLASALGVGEASLRRTVSRARRRVVKIFEIDAGISMQAGALIENAPWEGYRLNPAVVIVSADEIDVGSQLFRHCVTTRERSLDKSIL